MGKVVTSAGLNDFVSSGKVDTVAPLAKDEKPKEAPKLEVKTEPKILEPKAEGKSEPAADEAKDDERARTEDWKAELERKNTAINRKHREMMEAKEGRREAEDFAKAQWNEKRLSEDRIAVLERDLENIRKQAAPAVEKVKTKPDPKTFYDEQGQFKAFEYAEALAAHSASEAVENDRKAQAEVRRQAETQAAEAIAKERVAQTSKKYPDFSEVMASSDVTTHNAVLQYLSASEHIGEVSYYLAKNPDFVERINKLNPLKAIAEIGKLEATFETAEPAKSEPAAKVTQGAPPPIKSLHADAPVAINVDPAQMSFKELRAYERARKAKRS